MSAPAYDAIGRGYRDHRRPDPRIMAMITTALGDAAKVVNVGAGTGSYEPLDRHVVAVEPSPTMFRQRPPGAAPVIRATAEHLPFPDGSFDAALALLTIHHWADWRLGLDELRRVADRCVIFTFDRRLHDRFWLIDEYVPAAAATAGIQGAPAIDEIAAHLGGARVVVIPVHHDCTDGFGWAYWRRPERYLDPGATRAISLLAQLPAAERDAGLARLADDLATGRWHDRHRDLMALDAVDGGYRLVVG